MALTIASASALVPSGVAAFIYGMRAFFSGSRLVILPRFDAARVLSIVDEQRVTWTQLVPTMIVVPPFADGRVAATERGVSVLPILKMKKPANLKDIQQLAGHAAALSRFIARLGERALPFYALMKKSEKFKWTSEAQEAFDNLKKVLSTSPVLVTPHDREPMLLYIAATS